MPAFVPVFDPEVPRSEQDPNSVKLLKHRKWDNPHVVLPNNERSEKYDKLYKRSKYNRSTDKYNDRIDIKSQRWDDRFYRKNVRDDFDYVPPKRKKNLKADDKSKAPDKSVVKSVKKDIGKKEYK